MDNLKELSFKYSIKLFRFFPYLNRTIEVLMDINKDLNYEKINQEKILNILANHRKTFEVDCQNSNFDKTKSLEELFSQIRTDLDKFNRAEAQAIIYMGYKSFKEKLNIIKEHDFDFKNIELLWDKNELREIIKEAGEKRVWR